MKFLMVVCTLATIWIYADGMQFMDDELRAHEGEVIGCGGRRMQLNRQMKEVMCVPRRDMVKLIPPSGYSFYPNYAEVNKCNGYCPRNKCMPVDKQIKKIIVRMDGYNSSQCYHVSLTEHTKCKCKCSVTENHCNSHQVYSKNNCACECMNRIECDKKTHMVWSEESCKCICKTEEICSSGLEWVPSLCRCAKVMNDSENPSNISNYIGNL